MVNKIRIFLASQSADHQAIQNLLVSNTSLENPFILTWKETLGDFLASVEKSSWDIFLLDDHLAISTAISHDLLAAEIHVPLLLITDHDDMDAVNRCAQVGAADILPRDQLNGSLFRRILFHTLEQKRLAQALSRSENRFGLQDKLLKILMENTIDWEYWVDPWGVLLTLSPACERITGYTSQEFFDQPDLIETIIFPGDLEKMMTHFPETLGNYELDDFECDFRIFHKDNSLRWISHQCQAVYDKNGKYLARRVNNRDITERKIIEENLRKSETTLQQLTETISDVFWLITSDENIYISPNYEGVWGRSRSTFYENPGSIIESIHPDDRERVIDAYLSDEYQKNGRFNQEYRIIRPDGQVRWIRARTFFTRNQTEENRIVGVAEDITERKQTEQSLLASQVLLGHSEEKYRILVDNFPNGAVYLFDTDLRLTLFGGTSFILSKTSKNMEGKMLSECFPPDLYDILQPHIITVLSGNSDIVELSYEDRIYECRILPLHDKKRELIAILLLTQDITHHRQMEKDLNKMNETLTLRVSELRVHNQEAILLNRMGELIQSCRTVKEACKILESYLPRLIPGQSGAMYLFDVGNNYLEAAAVWGNRVQSEEYFTIKDCWALRRGQIHVSASSNISLRCPHLGKETQSDFFPYICIPLNAQGETLGLLHSHLDAIHPSEHQEALIQTIARWLSPALANLKLNENLHNLSVLDSLTRLYNRRYMEEILQREVRRASRHGQTIGLIMLDIDYFKQFNDTYGHGIGDVILQTMSRYLQSSIRAEDFACRFGGDEFILIIPETSLSDTHKRADQLLEGVKNLTIEDAGVKLPHINISVGVAGFPEHGSEIGKILQAVDQALYQAKQQGRGRVVMAG